MHHTLRKKQLSVGKVRQDSVVPESNKDPFLPDEIEPSVLQAYVLFVVSQCLHFDFSKTITNCIKGIIYYKMPK